MYILCRLRDRFWCFTSSHTFQSHMGSNLWSPLGQFFTLHLYTLSSIGDYSCLGSLPECPRKMGPGVYLLASCAPGEKSLEIGITKPCPPLRDSPSWMNRCTCSDALSCMYFMWKEQCTLKFEAPSDVGLDLLHLWSWSQNLECLQEGFQN